MTGTVTSTLQYDIYSVTVSGGELTAVTQSYQDSDQSLQYNGSDLSASNADFGAGNRPGSSFPFSFVADVSWSGGSGFIAQAQANGSSTYVDGQYYLFVVSGSSLPPVGTPLDNPPGMWDPDTGCFCAGTLIATPDGARPVESLSAGDLVLTASGAAVPVRWLGRSEVSRTFSDPLRVLPIRIAAGALGAGLPARDLLVSPDHALLLDGALVQASALVNHASITRDTSAPHSFTYYHLELDAHDLLLAEGVATESYLDVGAEFRFANEADRPARAAPMTELPYPRVKAARQLPRALRARIAARVALLLPQAAVAA